MSSELRVIYTGVGFLPHVRVEGYIEARAGNPLFILSGDPISGLHHEFILSQFSKIVPVFSKEG